MFEEVRRVCAPLLNQDIRHTDAVEALAVWRQRHLGFNVAGTADSPSNKDVVRASISAVAKYFR